MRPDLPMEGTNNGGAEQASSSDDGQFLVALRKLMKKEVEVMVIRTVQQIIVPTIGDLVRKVVKEEIQSVEKRLLTGGTRNASEMSMSKERSLQLKFLDEVSVPVLTGKPLKGKRDDSLTLALIDKATGQVVKSGPESSAKVEILVLDASDDDDDEHNWTLESFNNRIIKEGDKKKPHFAKSIYVYLKEGVGVLSNAKLGHDSSWMKSCKCRLGAKLVENLRGINVQEARTESFTVSDSRSKLYEKYYPPSLSDEVWRLDNIGKDGAPCKRLYKEKIQTVQDFLFMLSLDPQRLQRIVGAGAKLWKATVDHARTCIIDDKNIYLHLHSTDSTIGVIFNVVGELKGVINESRYVPINHLSPDEKDCAHNLLLSAFEDREKRISFVDESSLLQKFPYRSTDNTTFGDYYPTEPDTGQICNPILDDSTHFPSYQFPDLENTNGYVPTDPGTSSESFNRTFDIPNNNTFHFDSPVMTTTSQSCDFYFPGFISEAYVDNWGSMPVTNPDISNISETLRTESHSHQQSSARAYRAVGLVVNAMIWALRAKKRVMALGGGHIQKKQRV